MQRLLLLTSLLSVLYGSAQAQKQQNITLNSTYLLSTLGFGPTNKSIHIQNRRIQKIETNTFTNYTNLTHLDLANNRLGEIDLQLFQTTPLLHGLVLSNNPLTSLTNAKNVVLRNLTILSLMHTRLVRLDSNLVKGVPNLVHLSLTVESPYGIARLQANDLSPLTKLKELTLTVNNQTTMDRTMLNGLALIKTLHITNSGISMIDKSTFSNLTHLESIDLYHNVLTTLDGLQLPRKLKQLVVSNNLLASFNFQGNSNLITLDISNNRFKTLKSIPFSLISNLSYLQLNSNPIENPNNIFQDLAALINLHYLEAQRINMNSINPSQLQPFGKLRSLVLNDNLIAKIDAGAFNRLVEIRDIYLGNNQIKELKSASFAGLSQLSYIDLSNNKIATIESGAFRNLSRIDSINLDGNLLTKLDASMFAGLSNLKTISVHGNPFQSTANLNSVCPNANCQVLYD